MKRLVLLVFVCFTLGVVQSQATPEVVTAVLIMLGAEASPCQFQIDTPPDYGQLCAYFDRLEYQTIYGLESNRDLVDMGLQAPFLSSMNDSLIPEILQDWAELEDGFVKFVMIDQLILGVMLFKDPAIGPAWVTFVWTENE